MAEVGAAAGSSGPLGILACGGPLPLEIAEAGSRSGRPIHIVAIQGFADPAVARYPNEWVSLGQLGRMLSSFKQAGVREMVIAGAMQRPNLLALRVDWGFFRFLPTILALTKGGDDSVLRRVVRFFEQQDLTVLGVGETAPDLLAPSGTLTRGAPAPTHAAMIERASRLIADLGAFDVGQAVVADASGIVAVEGVRGTDALLSDLGPGGSGQSLGTGAVLVKLAKPGQEMRIDLPTIGPETVRRAEAAGLSGIAVGAGGAIVLERARVAAAADAAGLFVVGMEPLSLEAPAASLPDGQLPTPALAARSAVAARRAPTPGDRADIAIGRRVMAVLRAHQAGPAVIVAAEHVMAISARMPLPHFVAAQGRPSSWGRRTFRGRLGVLLVDPKPDGAAASPVGVMQPVLDALLFRAVQQAGLAGVVWLGPLPADERRREIVAWADEAGVFLMNEDGTL